MKDYFGVHPFLNMLASSFFFWTLEHRKKRLAFENGKKFAEAQQFVLENKPETANQFRKLLDSGLTKVNLGGGKKNLQGYINVDFEAHANIQSVIQANITDLDFIPDSCLTHVHSNHVVEHVTQDDFEKMLRSVKRILKNESVFTIRCPNILGVSYGFFHGAVAERDHDEFIAAGFPSDEEFANPLDNWYEKDIYAYAHWVWGDIGNPANQHLNIWTPTKMQRTLEGEGYSVIKMSEPEASNLVVVARVNSD